MHFGELEYLIEVIRLHSAPRNYEAKGTKLFPLDHEKMAIASQQIFLFFPKSIPSTTLNNRRTLINERISSLVQGEYSPDEFHKLGDMIEHVYINWTRAKKTRKAKCTIQTVRDKFSKLYYEILNAQNNRCVFCGILFDISVNNNMQLDHILPYNLGGDDNHKGSNWQFLCSDCNNGKLDLFTVFQYRGREDWIYPLKHWHPETEKRENWRRFRLIALIRDGKCMNCERGPDKVQLKIENLGSGLSLTSNMVCICEDYPECSRVINN